LQAQLLRVRPVAMRARVVSTFMDVVCVDQRLWGRKKGRPRLQRMGAREGQLIPHDFTRRRNYFFHAADLPPRPDVFYHEPLPMFCALTVILAAAPVLPAEDPAVCASCYEAAGGQTLPAVVTSVVVVLVMQWWQGRRDRKSAAA